jgi:hypothetical protein
MSLWINLSKFDWLMPRLMFLLVFTMAARVPLDTDFWWHLRAGEETWLTHRPVLIDHLSYTRAGAPWINHSWLGQVLIYLAYKLAGNFGVAGLVALIAAISMTLVYYQMRGNPLMRSFIIVLASAVAAPVWSPRPQIFTLLMLSGLACLYHRYKWRMQDRLWLIIPLFIIWSNLHGGYAVGILFLGLTLAGELLNKILGNRDYPEMPWHKIWKLGLWSFAAWAVVIINPNGTLIWAIPFKTINVGLVRESIDEWGSPDFHEIALQPFIWLFIGVLGAVSFSRRRLDLVEFLQIAGFGYMALLAKRNFASFAIVTAPIMTRFLAEIDLRFPKIRQVINKRVSGVRDNRDRAPKNRYDERKLRLLNTVLLGLVFTVGVMKLSIVTEPRLVDRFKAEIFPVGAVSWIKENQPERQLFNSYNWGGYLSWELREYPVFVDGRTDLYDDELLSLYSDISSGGPGWDKKLISFDINLVLIEANSGLAREMENSPNWLKGYEDEIAVVYIRREG